MTLKDLVNKYGGEGTIQQKIAAALPHIFSFQYPVYDQTYKTVLETKIVNHYLKRELCEYEEEDWNFALYQWLNEKMPLFNQRYNTTLLPIRPLINHWLESTKSGSGAHSTNESNSATVTGNETVTTDSSSESYQGHGLTTQNESSQNSTSTGSKSGSRSSNKTHKGSDAPNGPIDSIENGYITEGAIDTESASESSQESGGQNVSGNGRTVETGQQNGGDSGHAQTQQYSGQTTTGSTATQFSSTEQWLETVAGNVGVSQSKLLEEYRDVLIDIDCEIINAMAPLFVMVNG